MSKTHACKKIKINISSPLFIFDEMDGTFEDYGENTYECAGRRLDTLPSDLEAALTYLNFNHNIITDVSEPLRSLSSLVHLHCSHNRLLSLPPLPDTLQVLRANTNKLTQLCKLPARLRMLDIADNILTELPELPDSLTTLYANGNYLSAFPTQIHSSLRVCVLSMNCFKSISHVPSSVIELHLFGNELTSLPELPACLETLGCGHNKLASLPRLPVKLRYLDCSHNVLTHLPQIPDSVYYLKAAGNALVTLHGSAPAAMEVLLATENVFECETKLLKNGICVSVEMWTSIQRRYARRVVRHVVTKGYEWTACLCFIPMS